MKNLRWFKMQIDFQTLSWAVKKLQCNGIHNFLYMYTYYRPIVHNFRSFGEMRSKGRPGEASCGTGERGRKYIKNYISESYTVCRGRYRGKQIKTKLFHSATDCYARRTLRPNSNIGSFYGEFYFGTVKEYYKLLANWFWDWAAPQSRNIGAARSQTLHTFVLSSAL